MSGPKCYWCYTAIPGGYPCPNPDCVSHDKDRVKQQAEDMRRIADSLEKIVEMLQLQINVEV